MDLTEAEDIKKKWQEYTEKLQKKIFSSVFQSCPTLCHTMDCSTPGFPVLHQLLELIQTQIHPVGDGQGGLVCYSPWGRKESDMTEQLN